jgi:hypothetical protein
MLFSRYVQIGTSPINIWVNETIALASVRIYSYEAPLDLTDNISSGVSLANLWAGIPGNVSAAGCSTSVAGQICQDGEPDQNPVKPYDAAGVNEDI